MKFVVFLLSIMFWGCQPKSSDIPTQNQGIFDFADEMITAMDNTPPLNLEHENILCKGKGIRVARCISEQLKKGICLGIVKEGKSVYVVEIDCNNLKDEDVSEVLSE